jgi:phospholipid transport system substrate-binding protein
MLTPAPTSRRLLLVKGAPIIERSMRRILIILLLAGAVTAATARPETPERQVSETVRSLAGLVADCRLPLAADPVALRGVVDQHLRPNVDVLYAGQLILGRHWSDASPEQRRRFGESLYGTLAGRYATGLLLLTDSNVVVVPASMPTQEGEAVVEIRIQARFATPIPVYLQLRRGSTRWRVFDARWEDQSYILSLRQVFSQEIRREGLEAVIQRLEASAGLPVGLPEERDTAAGRCLRARQAR